MLRVPLSAFLAKARSRDIAAHGQLQSCNPRAAHLPQDQQYCDSILDSILLRLERRKALLEPDNFETFLRDLKETTLADIYHTLSSKSAGTFQNLFWFANVGPSCQPSSNLGIEAAIDLSYTSDDDLKALSVSEFFERIKGNVENKKPNSIALCCLSKTAPELSQVFSYGRLFRLSAYSEPRFWALTLSAYFLLWSRYINGPCADAIMKDAIKAVVSVDVKRFHLPSQKPSLATSDDMFWEFAWPYAVRGYSRVNYHTERPYNTKPILERIQYSDQEMFSGQRNLVMLFESSRALLRFKEILRGSDKNLLHPISTSPGNVHRISLHRCLVLFSVHELINKESLQFVEQAYAKIDEVLVKCRDHPGRSVCLFFLWLKDHADVSLRYTEVRMNHLRQLGTIGDPDLYGKRREALLHDGAFVLRSLKELSERLAASQNEAKFLEELKQAQVAGVIQFLVAIYVPLSFVTSYLGMNTVELLAGSTHTSTFWAISLPLMALTLLLPLLATIIARLTLAVSATTAAFSLRKWPMLVDFCILAFCLAVVVAHVIHWRAFSGDAYFTGFFLRLSPHETFIVDLVLAGLIVLKMTEQTVYRNRRARIWFLYFGAIAAVCTLCTALSFIDNTCATLVIPFGVMWFALAVRPLLF
ncbi:MAG: hypothetical protein LQ340_004909 [Diploschistes diacapsis]|nr:MAG: hypothetical protein LQ340_004909 [Diploschistes diacapsis]